MPGGPLTISAMTTLPAPLVGTELIPIVSPGNLPAANANFKMTAGAFAAAIMNIIPAVSPNTIFAGPSSGTALATATFRAMVTGDLPAFGLVNGFLATPRTIAATAAISVSTTDARVLFTTAAAGTSTLAMPDATLMNGPVLVKDIKGNVSATGPLIATFTSGQLADGLATVTINQRFGAYWFNPVVVGGIGSWYLTAG